MCGNALAHSLVASSGVPAAVQVGAPEDKFRKFFYLFLVLCDVIGKVVVGCPPELPFTNLFVKF